MYRDYMERNIREQFLERRRDKTIDPNEPLYINRDGRVVTRQELEMGYSDDTAISKDIEDSLMDNLDMFDKQDDDGEKQ